MGAERGRSGDEAGGCRPGWRTGRSWVLWSKLPASRFCRRDGKAAMGHFKSNLRDIEFNLFEVLKRQELLGSEPFPDVDEDTARGILEEVNRLATGPIAESFADADRHPPVFDPATRSVTMPESFRKSFRAFMDAEWFRLELPAELGGTVAPRSLHWAIAELILGANPAVWMYASGASMAHA